MGKCPRGLKTCEQVFIRYYEDKKHYLCFGVLKRKGRGGVRMDCIRHCIRGHYHKKPVVTDATPDEAIVFAAGFAHAVHEWLYEFGPYNEWRD